MLKIAEQSTTVYNVIKYVQAREVIIIDDSLLTPAEVATILKIKKNTVYEMIKRGELPAFRIGRKLRVRKDVLLQLQQEGLPAGESVHFAPETPVPPAPLTQTAATAPSGRTDLVICGQDIALDLLGRHLEREVHGLHVLRNQVGSFPGLMALYKGKVHLSACHLWDGDSDSYNIPYVRRLLPGIPTIIIHFARRQQGFYVQPGNPLNILNWRDLEREDVTMINREPGSGTRVLLDEQIRLLGIKRALIKGYETWVFSHLEVASRVARSMADVGLGNQKAALQVREVDFIPLHDERYELVIKAEDLHNPIIQSVLSILRSNAFRQEMQGMGDYNINEMGDIVAGA